MKNELSKLEKALYDALRAAYDHLEFCGYGDQYERECARDDKLAQKLEAALALVEGSSTKQALELFE